VSRFEQLTERARASQTTFNALITLGEHPATGSGSLNDLVIAHKDLFCTRGQRTTAGSKLLADHVPAYDATVVARLAAAGARSLGKASLDEFAFGSSNEHCAFGAVANPWDLDRVPGGSSGGSAALVAARLVDAATASDTGGSIRQPAAFCGVTGIKPTYGRVSRYGMVAFASSLDQAGVIAPDALTCARLLEVIAGPDSFDATLSQQPVPTWQPTALRLDGLKIGVLSSYLDCVIDPAISAAIAATGRTLEALGAVLKPVALNEVALAIPSYYVIATAEAASNLSRYDGVRFGARATDAHDLESMYRRTRSQGLGREAQRRVLLGTFVLSAGYQDAYYGQALKARTAIRADFAQALSEVDMLLAPVTPTLPFRRGEKLSDPTAMYAADVMTVGVSLAGLPALSMPAGFSHGLPIGAQLIGKPWDESAILNVAHAFQQATEFHRALPPGVKP
jgi:aspartyl-tRNA(Asn)/glutamyl-tRNA(Gln) amidotransferase subunit A